MAALLAAVGITGYLLWPHPAPSQTQSQTRTAQPGPPSGQTVLPFTGLKSPSGVAVDTAGDLYVIDGLYVTDRRVLELAAGSATPTVLPFTGLGFPHGVAVDSVGDLYVTDFVNGRVLKQAAGSATPTVLPFTGLKYPWGVAVDAAGNLYVVDSGNVAPTPFGAPARVVKLPAGSSTQTELPFTGLNSPDGCGGGHRRQPLRRRL